jgi:glycosyltransferase involved in cell wall biosynthesis
MLDGILTRSTLMIVGTLPVTVVIPTLNEAPRLAAAVESVRWANEVLVADGGSTDETVAVAERSGARVVRAPGRTVGGQRNAAIELARNPWILALDADERATDELRESMAELCNAPRAAHAAYRVRSRNWHLGRELRHGPWGNDWKLRVFTCDHRFNDARVHENLLDTADVGTLGGTLIHYPYRDLAHQVTKIATYARWAAEDMRARGRRASLLDLLARPAWRFIRDYLVYSGWRDGSAGFIVAVVSAFSVFCKYASLLTAPD